MLQLHSHSSSFPIFRHQRKDDTRETVENRINVYESETAVLIGYYEKQGVLVDFDGEKSHEEVFADVVKAIEAK